MSKTNFDILIAGNNVAALVAADSLSERHNVALINPSGSWGAHFGGAIIHGDKFDLGMNFLEFTSYNPKSDDILSYDPATRNDCGRFFHLVEKFVKDLVEVREVPSPKMLLEGIYMSDGIVANDFEDLSRLSPEVKGKMINELEAIVSKENPFHASNKGKQQRLFLETDFATISIANHGRTFHSLFIQPLCNKILNIDPAAVPALYHRIAWAPLLYPETLLAFLKKVQNPIGKTPFHYPASGYFSVLIEKLFERIQRKSNVTIVQGKVSQIRSGGSFQVQLDGGEIFLGEKLIWTQDLGQYLKLADDIDGEVFDKTSIALVFVKLAAGALKKEISTLTILDTGYDVYRITNQTYCSGQNSENTKLVLEINFEYFMRKHPEASESDLCTHSIGVLGDLGFVANKESILDINAKILRNALNLPTLGNFNKFDKMYRKIESVQNQNLILLGQASGYVSTSLNDHIVQGLRIGTLLN